MRIHTEYLLTPNTEQNNGQLPHYHLILQDVDKTSKILT